MKVEQRDIKFTYHFSGGNETMKSLLENSGCRERTPSCQGQHGWENLRPDVSDRRWRSPTRTPSQHFPGAFVSNGFDTFIPKWFSPSGSLSSQPLWKSLRAQSQTSSTRHSAVTAQLHGSQGEPLLLRPLGHQDQSRSPP